MNDIITAPSPKLRISAEIVSDINQDSIDIIKHMQDVMHASNAIGLSSTQLGYNKRIIIIDIEKVDAFENKDALNYGKFEMINPVIESRKGTINLKEGCLSIPEFKESVERSLTITVSYTTAQNEKLSIVATGLLAACIQHEIDHLDGRLFIDKISTIKKDIIIRKLKKLKRQGIMVVDPSQGFLF